MAEMSCGATTNATEYSGALGRGGVTIVIKGRGETVGVGRGRGVQTVGVQDAQTQLRIGYPGRGGALLPYKEGVTVLK